MHKQFYIKSIALLFVMVMLFSVIMPITSVFGSTHPSTPLYINNTPSSSGTLYPNKTLTISCKEEVNTWQIMKKGMDEWVTLTESNPHTLIISPAIFKGLYTDPLNKKISIRAMLTDSTYSETITIIYQNPQRNIKNSNKSSDNLVYITINYLDEETNETLYTAYTGQITIGTDFIQDVISPTFLGYEAYYIDENSQEQSASTLHLAYYNVTENITINVYYRAIDVPYTVRYFFQNIDNDEYTENQALYYQGTAKTGSLIDNDELTAHAGDTSGFEKLYHYPEHVAADGSTVFKCYYDRNYYLVQFDLDGGYGIDPIFGRYGTRIAVPSPSKYGFSFVGWKEVSPDGSLSHDYVSIPSFIPAHACKYKAIWERANTTFTVIYWKEHADDNGYEYWGQKTVSAISYTSVNGIDYKELPNELKTDDYQQFDFFSADSNVIIEADGSTYVNVRYNRKFYEITLTRTNITCQIEEHSHNDNCYSNVCGIEEHHHDASCGLICTLQEHVHSAVCCDIPEHSHEKNCWTTSNLTQATSSHQGYTNYINTINNPTSGCIYRYGYSRTAWGSLTYHNYIYLGNRWYYLGTGSGTTFDVFTWNGTNPSRNQVTQSTVVSNPACGLTPHTHNGSDCHYACGLIEHTHGSTCYSCGLSEHTHTTDCKALTCTIPEHTHTNNCNRSGTNILKIIRAKYGQKIGEEWTFTTPSAGSYPQTNPVTSWNPSGSTLYTQRFAKIQLMPAESFTAAHYTTSNSTKTYYYYIECLPGETAETIYNGHSYRNLEGSPMVIDFNYWTAAEDFFDIAGYDKGDVLLNGNLQNTNNRINLSSGDVLEMYYTRTTRYEVELINGDHTTIASQHCPYSETVINIVNDYTPPPYPSTLEPNAYEFSGWYTTQTYIPGTEVTASTTMPNSNFPIYAKWTPIEHTVRFFYTERDMRNYENTGDTSGLYNTVVVPHRGTAGLISPPADPSGNDYMFAGWFQQYNGTTSAYSPQDINVTHDMNVYAEWSSTVAQPYVIHYALYASESDNNWLNRLNAIQNPINQTTYTVDVNDTTRMYVYLDGLWHQEIADDTKGFGYQGATRTYIPKTGMPANQLFAAYNLDYYPTVLSHSMVLEHEVMGTDHPENNVYTFLYAEAHNLEYTVNYKDRSTNAFIGPGTVTKPATGSVIMERFYPIVHYLPDAFYKKVVLAVIEDPDHPGYFISSPDNQVTFYYTPNENAAYYAVHFLLQDIGTDGTHYAIDGTGDYKKDESRIEGIADIGSTANITPLEFAGFTAQSPATSVINNNQQQITLNNNCFPLNIDASGSELYIYYTRNTYNFIVKYLDYNTHLPIAPDKEYTESGLGKLQYGTYITETAIDITGMNCVSATTQMAQVHINESQNEIIFYYVPLQFTAEYIVIGNGTLTSTIEVHEGTQPFLGSSPITSEHSEFIGWFMDEECTIPAEYSTSNLQGTASISGTTLIPILERMTPSPITNKYYAKFRALSANLTIERSNTADECNGTRSFIYLITRISTGETLTVTIEGTSAATIYGLPLDQYTIEQMNEWSFRYSDSSITVNLTENTQVIFNDAAGYPYWLTGNASRRSVK